MPSNNPNVMKNLAPKWEKGKSGNPKGRPPKMETILKQYFLDEHQMKLTKGQMQDVIKNLLSKTRAELVELANNDQLPFWISMIAQKANRDFKKGSVHLLDVLFDRVYGKPKEEQETNVIVEQPLFSPLNPNGE